MSIPNTFTGQGLEFARENIAAYRAQPSPFQVADDTRFVNILITDGQTSAGSSDVQAELQSMAADGADTYVIGFGNASELDEAQLHQYAGFGNTGSAVLVDPDGGGSAAALADAIEAIIRSIDIDACCILDDCSMDPEPADPKPVCGDGRVEGDEICDEGDDNGTYGGCGATCQGPDLYCGDQRVDGPEECDDGNLPSNFCDSDCLRPAQTDAGSELDAGYFDFTPPPPLTPLGGTGGSLDAGASDAGHGGGDGGCGCRVLGQRGGSPGWLPAWTLLLLTTLWRGRRRRLAYSKVVQRSWAGWIEVEVAALF